MADLHSRPTHPSSRLRAPRLELSDAPTGRCVVIRCNGLAFAYRCLPGRESELLDQVLADARNDDHPLSFFDAALIAHRLGQQISADLDETNASEVDRFSEQEDLFRRGA